jgi:pantoate--beta-alanine ligase
MQIVKSVKKLRTIIKSLNKDSIGLISTMGNLHQGHTSLIKKSLEDNDKTILTIFVNPTQFNNKEDLDNYPIILVEDQRLAEKLGIDLLFLPQYKEIYPDNFSFKVTNDDNFSKIFEGKYRPNHFTGVLTVVLKLLLITKPNKAYFGEKDYQQLKLVQDMTKAFLLDVDIVPCKTIRNENNLPLSSRNNRLSPCDLKKASLFSKLLNSDLSTHKIKSKLVQEGFKVEYIEEYNNRKLGAVRFENIRLIDNIEVKK